MARTKKQIRKRGLVVTRHGFVYKSHKFEIGDEFDPVEFSIPPIKYIQLISSRRIAYGDIIRTWEERIAAEMAAKKVKAKAEKEERVAIEKAKAEAEE